jgi:diguanylate cyclase (GGDEF)-like protein
MSETSVLDAVVLAYRAIADPQRDDAKLSDEPARLAALQRYTVLDTPAEPAFDKITGLVQTIFNVPIAAVSLIDADRQWFKSCLGLSAAQTPREVSFCTHTITGRAPMVIENAALDPRFADNPFVVGAPYIASYLGVPLTTPDGYNIGALCAIDRVPRRFSTEQIEIMRSFAALVIDELELRSLVRFDQLTGAVSRRGFLAEVDKAAARLARHGRGSAVVSFDLDHFKAVNDTHGHAAGDAVLRGVGQCCMGLTRVGDCFGRLGGEEFAILLPDSGAAEAQDLAERMRHCIAALQIAHEPPLRVTASFGIGLLDAAHPSTAAVLEQADVGLYQAKRGGRNRCCLAETVTAG